ncbi:alpha-N-arabinofuranosidase [Sphingomonas sp. LB-2]|uniref:alpha-N-arabinofuranosidase n=1 Tax=Sphingomonas caeni TaxID=2984949 RepID=UPI0022313419|nr:alpha-L-arabinofuranosidase C-terminal domain-containing protein [Sphingomonas caeni]MCW3846514.1 alpha-N-arabinofuranosidase [Sphingomonas caeni]
MAIRMMAAALLALATPALAGTVTASGTIDTAAKGVRIAPEIYGQFAEQLGSGITGGIWVGEDSSIPNIRGYRRDVVEALQKLHVPVIRWPGGCYADIYHWRDAIGPRGSRPVTLNKWWGNKEEDNQFGTNEFFDFAELLGSKTYLNVNVGSAGPAESMDWIEYITHGGNSTLAKLRRANGRDKPWKLDYVGIGNEMWGCGGNLRAEEFAPMVRRWGTFLKQDGTRLIAGGATGSDYHWTDVLMSESRARFDDISLHYYTLPTGDWGKKGSAIGFDEAAWTATFKRTRALETMIVGHDAAMTKYDPEKKQGLIVAEWGTWYDPTPGTNAAYLVQENTLRDALVAATNFNIFHRHADRVHGANIAQMVNVLQAMIHTDGARMVLTPTYWAFLLYQPFQGATALPVGVTTPDYAEGLPAIDVTAARGADGKIHVAITNVDPNNPATLNLSGLKPGTIAGQILTAKTMDARNSYAAPGIVVPAAFAGASWQGGKLVVKLPAKSLVVLTLG